MGMPVIKPGTITRPEAVGDIISSIAMQETALAHILNAESEKIMAVVNNDNATPEELLKINASVQKQINTVTRLVMQLHAKLDMFNSVICE